MPPKQVIIMLTTMSDGNFNIRENAEVGLKLKCKNAGRKCEEMLKRKLIPHLKSIWDFMRINK